jgi:hypothetical protein
MKWKDIRKAKSEATRFLRCVQVLEDKAKKTGEYDNPGDIWGCKESGALRRSSMDLTRSLATMRKPGL